MSTVILLVIIAIAVLWFISAYNGLISLKNQTLNAWKQIDVQLKRRHDLIPNLIETVKGAMNFEKETLEAVISARNKAITAVAGANPQNVAGAAQAEGQLTGALSRLLAVVESYPDLKATANVGQLQEELTSTENKISFARQMYNDTATQYNTRQQQFPTNLVTGMAQAVPAQLWEITDEAERAVPKVDLGFGKRS
ncbi:MAG TPA: LemA family protein [Gemmatimonadaceae bacterium]|nr:LemA family protein [Gemmatimonadaceae bacterium]